MNKELEAVREWIKDRPSAYSRYRRPPPPLPKLDHRSNFQGGVFRLPPELEKEQNERDYLHYKKKTADWKGRIGFCLAFGLTTAVAGFFSGEPEAITWGIIWALLSVAFAYLFSVEYSTAARNMRWCGRNGGEPWEVPCGNCGKTWLIFEIERPKSFVCPSGYRCKPRPLQSPKLQ